MNFKKIVIGGISLPVLLGLIVVVPALAAFVYTFSINGNSVSAHASSPTPTPQPKVKLCHLTDSETNPWVVQSVNANEVASHEDNGDFPYLGECEGNGNTLKTCESNWCANHNPNATPTPSVSPTPTPTAPPTHHVCNEDHQCVLVEGAGKNSCEANEDCLPTPTPTPTSTPTPTETPSPTPTPCDEDCQTPTPTPTPTPSESPSPTPTPVPCGLEQQDSTPCPTETPSPTPTPSQSPSPTPTPCDGDCPTESPSPTPTPEQPTPTPNPNDSLTPAGAPPVCTGDPITVAPSLLGWTRLSPTDIHIWWSPSNPWVTDYIVHYGLSKDNLPWNDIVYGHQDDTLHFLPANQPIWVGVQGYHCVTGPMSVTLDP